MGYLIHVLITAVALILTAYIVPGFSVQSIPTALLAALVLSLLNLIVKPILTILTLPITLITFGLFSFVINALLLLATAHFIGGFTIANFWAALLGAILISLVSTVLNHLINNS